MHHRARTVVDRAGGAGAAVAAVLHHKGVPGHPHVKGEPVKGVQGAVAQGVHQLGVAQVVAAHEHVLGQGVCTVLDALALLGPAAGGRVAKARERRAAAKDVELLQEHHRRPRLCRADGCGQACAAGAHHHDVGLLGDRGLAGALGLGALLPLRGVLAGILQGRGDGGLVGKARDGGTAHGVDVQGLVAQHELADDVLGRGAHAQGLVGA